MTLEAFLRKFAKWRLLRNMKAAEARDLVAMHESVDNSGIIIGHIQYAAYQGERSVRVSPDLMTDATREKLIELGYEVESTAIPDWTQPGGRQRVCRVSW